MIKIVKNNGRELRCSSKTMLTFQSFQLGCQQLLMTTTSMTIVYISRIALKQFPQSQPLWEIHLVKYPTSKAAGNIIFKLHHALGDGFSLMGALLSCLQRADNPSLSLTFPSLPFPSNPDCSFSKLNITVPKCISSIFNTISDFGWSLLKRSFVGMQTYSHHYRAYTKNDSHRCRNANSC